MKRLVFALALIATPAFAQQQQSDVATLQKALQVLQQQRNNAMDALASATTQATMLQEENTKLKADLAEALKKEFANAKQHSQASPNDGSGSTQPQVRQEVGDPTSRRQGIQPSR